MPLVENTVLIIDDDSSFRSVVSLRLKKAGYDVTEASDGQEAIEILKVESPDVVLLDINMPNINGLEVLEWVKYKKALETNVIVLTGETSRDHVVTSLTLGAKDFLVKSEVATELLKRVNRLREIKILEEKNKHSITEAELRAAPILVVDDHELTVDLTAKKLEKEGFSVCKAYSAHEALKILEQQLIHLALLDIDMPDVNGFELLQRLMESTYKESLAIIMVSANDESDMIIDCIQNGADDYIVKPYHKSELSTRVQTTLRYKLNAYKEHLKRCHHEELAQFGEQLRKTQ